MKQGERNHEKDNEKVVSNLRATQNQEYAKTKLTMPVLALGGDHSGGSFIVSQMQAVAENVQGGALENTGHWIAEEQPEELTRQLLQFFGKD